MRNVVSHGEPFATGAQIGCRYFRGSNGRSVRRNGLRRAGNSPSGCLHDQRRSLMRNVQDYTLGDPETATCPYDYYKAMRTQDPVHYDEKIKTFIVSRHEDIMKALADPITFSVEHGFNAQERQDYSGE